MAQTSWPSLDNGKVVNDSQFERLGVSFGPTAGLVGSPGDAALVYADSTGLQVKIRADQYALVRGFEWWSGSSDFTIAVASNSSGSTRIDLVVLRLNRSTWNVTVSVVTGTPGSGSAPAATQNTGSTGVWELPIATVTVASGASTIAAGNVTFAGLYLANDGSGYVAASPASLAFIPEPFEGQQIRVVSAGQKYRRTATGTWAPTVLFVRKTVEESVVNTTTPQDDDELFVNLEATGTYLIDTVLFFWTPSGSVIDVRVDSTFPAGATASQGGIGPSVDLANDTSISTGDWLASWNDTSSPTPYHQFGATGSGPTVFFVARMTTLVVMGGTAGTWRLRWAQANLFPSYPVRVMFGSSVRAVRLP